MNTPPSVAAVLRLIGLHLRRSGNLWQLLLPCAAALLAPGLLALSGHARAGRALAPFLTLAVLIGLWCVAFVPALLRQNRPLAARLVPGQLQRLRQVLTGAWLIASVGGGALLMAWHGVSYAAALGYASLLLLLVWLMRWPWLWLAVWLVPVLLEWYFVSMKALALAGVAFVGAQPWLATAMLLLVALLGLPFGLRSGDAAHLRQGTRGVAQRSRSTPPGRWMQAVQRWAARPYLARLAALSHPGSAAMARALCVFGPSGHWTAQATGAVCVLVGVSAVLTVLTLADVPLQRIERHNLAGAVLGLMSFALYPLWQLRVAAQRTLREQALLSLVPGLPRGAAFNRALAARVLVWNLVAWAGGTTLAWAVLGTLEGPPALLTAATFGSLPFCVHNLRDWSRRRMVHGVWPAGQGAGEVLAVGSVVLGWWALMRWGGVAPGTVMGVSVLLGAALVGWRWRQLGRWPMAWPPARR